MKWMIETPPDQPGARADSQWTSVTSGDVELKDGALIFLNKERDPHGFGPKIEKVLILAPGTWLSVHPDKEQS